MPDSPAGAGKLCHAARRAGLRDNGAAMSEYKTIEDVIGATPLVRLVRLPGAENARRGNVILGKLEGNNPAGSVKDQSQRVLLLRGCLVRDSCDQGEHVSVSKLSGVFSVCT